MLNNQRTQELLAQEGLESISQKLYNTINFDLPGNHNSGRRWTWELLQNAKDVILKEGKVQISLEDKQVTFSHNGSPFLHHHLLALLSQRSTKSHSISDVEKEEFFNKLFSEEIIDENTVQEFLSISGRFGTGFMTTYLLSKKITLSSIYKTEDNVRYFTIPLDRDAETEPEMKSKVKDSFSSFTELEQSNSPDKIVADYIEGSKCYTEFKYEFEGGGVNKAELGILDLHNSIPYTLCFVEKITSIEIVERGLLTTYSRIDSKPYGKINIITIEKITADVKEIIEIAKASARYDSLSVAIKVKATEDKKKYSIQPLESHLPKQFISFPLVGSELFPFPVIVNSPMFNPFDNTRSHLCLNVTQSEDFNRKVELNRNLLIKALELYKVLLEEACLNEWENIHFLAKSDLPLDSKDEWYKENIQKEIRKVILESEIVHTENSSKPIKPRDAKFPVYRSEKLEDFWNLCTPLLGEKIPRRQDAEIWKTIIEANTDQWLGIQLNFGLEDLLSLVEKEITFNDFSKKYFTTPSDAFKSLNNIIQFTEEENKDLLDRKEKAFRIFPNQTEELTFVEKKELSRDINIPNEIKEVLKLVGENWFEKLVHNSIKKFERDSKLTVKQASDRIKDKIEKFPSKLSDVEKVELTDGLYALVAFYSNPLDPTHKQLHGIADRLFPLKIKNLTPIIGAEDFEWKACQIWFIKHILSHIQDCGDLTKLCLYLFNKVYPQPKDDSKAVYSLEEGDLMFKVDSFLNEIIEFSLVFENNQYHLLDEYAVIPNQQYSFRKFNGDIYNDDGIPPELKNILKTFGSDCGKILRHPGVSIKLPDSKSIKWICTELDDIAIKERENDDYKQPIRELDKWISKNKGKIVGMDELFKSFYKRRSGIVLNTYGMDERDQFDAILKSGMGSELAEVVKGANRETIEGIAKLAKEENLNKAIQMIKEYPELTTTKIEQLLRLEELSKGWDTNVNQPEEEKTIRQNFENGWKGEAFVYKQLLEKNYNVIWPNKALEVSENVIIDYSGEQHYIKDRGDKYDLIIENSSDRKVFVQVKSTTTDIANADHISMPISTREWGFIHETKENESYYLARVFNVNSDKPQMYFMKLGSVVE